jgi:hypothetical protein
MMFAYSQHVVRWEVRFAEDSHQVVALGKGRKMKRGPDLQTLKEVWGGIRKELLVQ